MFFMEGRFYGVPAGGSAKVTGGTAEGTAAAVIITFKAAN
jgi:hypothetical protein